MRKFKIPFGIIGVLLIFVGVVIQNATLPAIGLLSFIVGIARLKKKIKFEEL